MKIDLKDLLTNIAMDITDVSDIVDAFAKQMTNEQLIKVAKTLNNTENLCIPYLTDSWLNDIKETIVDIVKERAYDWAAIQYEDIQEEIPSLEDVTFDEALRGNVRKFLTALRTEFSKNGGYTNFMDVEDILYDIDNFYDDESAIEALTYIVNYIFENNDIIDIINGNVKNYPTKVVAFDNIVFEGGIDSVTNSRTQNVGNTYEKISVTSTNNDYLI